MANRVSNPECTPGVGVATECCPVRTPKTLKVTLDTGEDGDMAFNESTVQWAGSVTASCGDVIDFTLECHEDAILGWVWLSGFQNTGTGGMGASNVATSAICDAFSTEYTNVIFGGCLGFTPHDYSITE